MTHINHLPVSVLAQILYKVAVTPANTLSEWKAKLPLVAVCRAWTELAIATVFYQVYVEVEATHSNTRPSWTSSAEFLISRGCILKAKRLTIELADRVTPECLQSIALEILQLDCVDWQDINTLTITGPSIVHQYYRHISETEEASNADIARIMEYFRLNLRNVVELDLAYSELESKGYCICSWLVRVYGGQLQIYRALDSISFSFIDFSRNIKVLELTLNSSTARILPSICGETLRVLKLDEVPRNFAWHHFRYETFDRPIVFPQLTILRLGYQHKDTNQALTEYEIQHKVASGAHCCDQLSFPALRDLEIRRCTPDCDLLYADLPFPKLKKVHLSGTINSIRHCSRLKLAWVEDLEVTVFPTDPGDTTDFYRATSHFFTNVCIGRTAALNVFLEWFILDPELMRWANLTILTIETVDFNTVCMAIGRLPNLTELGIYVLQFGDNSTYSSSADASLFTSADPLLSWAEKLTAMYIYDFDEDYPLIVCASGIQDLILHMGALKKLVVPYKTKQLVVSFIDMCIYRFPNMANIHIIRE
ncbi:hypothetical protein GGH94_003156 [Coemansia aciculifera]|uniref:F-box domain-containing protein n=1 Tax=Coemansia aciculifera TaxID=417176 RepID=A0A9W8IHL1_9FUNG|nr:hypothetical protein GGH94_003156 [Coemansia aciculifera]KAJ2876662.1 hypothetical protein GGH93_000544 [Coemansia aciculifera]